LPSVIALIGRAPERAGGGVDGLADAVADAGSVNLDELAFRREFEDVGAMKLTLMGVGVIDVGAGADGDEHVLAVFGEDNVARPVAAAGELGVTRNVGNDGLSGTGGVEIAQVVREALDGGGVADVDVPWIVRGVEGDAERMVEAGGELFNLGGLAVGAHAAQDEEDAGAGVGEEQVAVGRDADEARHGEGACGSRHVLDVVGSLHGRVVASGV
jgi:hypothetical protein